MPLFLKRNYNICNKILCQAPIETMKRNYLMFHTMAPELAIEDLKRDSCTEEVTIEKEYNIIMRLFISINLSQEIKETLINLQKDWYDLGVRGNYSSEENLHLTLAFIGEYLDSMPVMNALQSVTFAPIPLQLEGIGAFGNLWWAGVTYSPALEAVAKRIRRALAEKHIPFDKKKFNPHITLLRRASVDRIPSANFETASMTVNTISLMRSDRGKNGMIYTEVGSIQAKSSDSPDD